MSVQILNTRSLTSGFRPGALLEGQLFFNLPDRLMFVGDDSNEQKGVDGSTTPCPPGEGWFEVLLTIPQLDNYFLISPQYYGDIPTDGQFLQWDNTLNHSVWSDVAASGGASYLTTNAAVFAAPGGTTSDKINSVLGAPALVEGDTVIVSGVSGDPYQGLYIYSGSVWNFAALFASPNASYVSFDNTGTTLAATEVQAALVELDTDVVTAQTAADAAQTDATQAIADAATAQTAADAAQTDATQAIADATTAQTAADAAQTDATQALTNAATAQTTADAAQTDATQALADAAAAQTTADAALPLTGGTMTGPVIFDPGQTIPISGIPDASTVDKGIVQIGTNIQVSSGVISVNSATTSVPGIVELNDTTSSTSVTEALTANQGYSLQQQINALVVSNNITLGGTIDGSTGLVATTTPEGVLVGLAAGSVLPLPGTTNAEVFVIASVGGTMTPPGGVSTLVHVGDWWLSDGTSWVLLDVGYQYPYATTTSEGVVQLATNAEAQAGLNTNHALVPSSLQSKLSDSISTTSSTTIASSTAVKTAYDLADVAIPDSIFTSKGEILAGTGSSTYTPVVVGTNGYILTADSAQTSGIRWQAPPAAAASAQPAVEGLVFGLTQNSVSGYNVSLGFGANGTLTTGTGNVAIGGASGDVTSGSYNVAIGFDTSVADPTGDKQLAIGPDAYTRWLTGDSSMNIKPGAGLVDATNSTGTAGQILSSTGTALQWINNTADGVLGVTGTTPVNVDNTDPQNPVISVDAGTTTITGVVQLENSISSISTTTAATPNSVKTVYDLADAALPKTGGTMTGDIIFVNGQPVDAGFF